MAAKVSAVESRAQDSLFVRHCSLSGLQGQLPLLWPTPPDVPPCPKKSYRSQYEYLGFENLQDPEAWETLSDFDLVLRLVDFSGLRPVLAQRLGWTSAQGWRPFDPVSMFLLQGWQIVNGWTRAETLRNLRDARYADYARLFGFREGIYPTEGGLRHFLTALGHHSDVDGDTVIVEPDQDRTVEVPIQYLNHLLAGAVTLIREAGLLSPELWNRTLVCPDGMLHDAASRLRCTSVRDSCYKPTTAAGQRPCPAQEKGNRGCDCDTLACAEVCKCATPRDREARYVWYSGSNQRPDNPNRPTDPTQKKRKQGRGRYGYRSLPLLLADPVRRFHLSLLSDFRPANDHEAVPATALLLQLALFYPDLHLDTFVGDAGFGTDLVLRTVYCLGARRVVDLCARKTDKNKELWPIRGYNDKGRPICPFGYAFTANGYDAQRQRYKWFCGQVCRQGAEPVVLVEGACYPPKECPYRQTDLSHGRILNIGETFADGSLRLVRDVPFRSPAWKRLYHQARNASESRNATFERWKLKRLPVYGGLRAKAIAYLADTWATLTTLARLVREATFATSTA